MGQSLAGRAHPRETDSGKRQAHVVAQECLFFPQPEMHRCIRNGGKTTQCVPAELSINSAMTFLVSSACPARMRLVRPKRVLHTQMCIGSGLTLRSTTRPVIKTVALASGADTRSFNQIAERKRKLDQRGLAQVSDKFPWACTDWPAPWPEVFG